MSATLGNLKYWIYNHHPEIIDNLVEQYENADLDTDNPLGGYPVKLSLESFYNHLLEDDQYDDLNSFYDVVTTPKQHPDDHRVNEKLVEFFVEQLEDHGFPDASPEDEWRVCWTDPVDHQYISPRQDTADLVGKQVALRGRIVHATKPATLFTEIAFECQRCGTLHIIDQPAVSADDDWREPHECQGCERQGPFAADIAHPDTERVSTQYLRIEEVLGEQDIQSTPEDIDVRVYHSARTSKDWQRGEVVEVVGRIALDTRSRPAKSYVVASSVEPETDRQDVVEVTDEDKDEIESIIDEHGVLDAAEQSVAPHIFGEDLAKQGLFLTMVGHSINDDSLINMEDAPDLNAGLWGEPGTGKSELLEFVHKVHPKSRHVDASGATFAGITAAADHEEIAGDSGWVVHPGAIPRASGGVVTMDELDKIDFPPSRLSDLLWQNEMEIDKGPIDAHIRTDVGVVAAANPDDDYLDPTDSLKHQFERFEEHFLDRFPLAYPFKRDLSNKERQEGIKTLTANRYRPEADDTDNTEALINRKLLRKWLYLARQQTPEMTHEAVDTIEETFGSFRENNAEADGQGIDISNRRYNSLFWLANAHARARLSDKVTEHDAEAAIHHMMQMLGEWGYSVEGESPFAGQGDTDDDDDGDDGVADSGSAEPSETEGETDGEEDDAADADEIQEYAHAHPDATVDEVLTQVDPGEGNWESWAEQCLIDARKSEDIDDEGGGVDPETVLGDYRDLVQGKDDMTASDILAEFDDTLTPEVLDADEDEIKHAVAAVINEGESR